MFYDCAMYAYVCLCFSGFLRGFKIRKKLGISIEKIPGKEKVGIVNVSWEKLGKLHNNKNYG